VDAPAIAAVEAEAAAVDIEGVENVGLACVQTRVMTPRGEDGGRTGGGRRGRDWERARETLRVYSRVTIWTLRTCLPASTVMVLGVWRVRAIQRAGRMLARTHTREDTHVTQTSP